MRTHIRPPHPRAPQPSDQGTTLLGSLAQPYAFANSDGVITACPFAVVTT